jgi:crotonobetainyl-CoA:carnitine CoA-transferase CaiB-like acyl-CoA transferase
LETVRPTGAPTVEPGRLPFEGLRVLDLGVIVAGGELGRLFADHGAEVIKVESAAYPDGLRQTPPGQPMSRSWALTHRNESSLGLDLRSPEGAALFRRLVSASDAVFANFVAQVGPTTAPR